jgi:hypothetical protein
VARHAGTAISGEEGAKEETGFSGALGKAEEFGK